MAWYVRVSVEFVINWTLTSRDTASCGQVSVTAWLKTTSKILIWIAILCHCCGDGIADHQEQRKLIPAGVAIVPTLIEVLNEYNIFVGQKNRDEIERLIFFHLELSLTFAGNLVWARLARPNYKNGNNSF